MMTSKFVEAKDDAPSEDEGEAVSQPFSREALKKMAKCIKLIENQNKLMPDTLLRMQITMEKLIKKIVKKGNRPVLKATDKLTKSIEVL